MRVDGEGGEPKSVERAADDTTSRETWRDIAQKRLSSFGEETQRKPDFFTVTELNQRLKQLIESAANLRDIWVKGEISNFRLYPSGHAYFTLKDSTSQMPAVMWRGQVRSLKFDPKDGQAVLVRGAVVVYESGGKYQVNVMEMRPEGVGELFLRFKQLHAKLEAEGLFAEERKKKIPEIPATVGIVTAKKGAAIQDMLRIIRKRRPQTQVILKSVRVQGEGAAEEIATAIGLFNRARRADVLIVGRGGGSIEDLWEFNEEIVARAIAASGIPVISAVGHESDFTIADFVADVRAPTPTAAAQLAVPDNDELLRRIQAAELHLTRALSKAVRVARERLDGLLRQPVMRQPERVVMDARQRVDELLGRLGYAGRMREEAAVARLAKASGVLESLSPLKTLARGYAVALDARGKTVSTVDGVAEGEALRVRVKDGEFGTKVTGKRRL